MKLPTYQELQAHAQDAYRRGEHRTLGVRNATIEWCVVWLEHQNLDGVHLAESLRAMLKESPNA